MGKTYPDYMGTYKALVLDGALQEKNGMPWFVVRVALSEYFDQKEGEWMDVSDNNWAMNAYFALYGRKGGEEGGEIVATLNHQQLCKVFGWDGCGLDYLAGTDFSGKTVQVRVVENTYEKAKTPVTIEWIDVEDADPNSGLQKLDPAKVKELSAKFQHLWAKKTKPVVTAAPKPAAKPAPTVADPPNDPEEIMPDPADKKQKMLEKSKRIREAAKPPAVKPKAPPVVKPKAPPAAAAEPSEDSGIPADFGKKQAWNTVVELKNDECSDEQLNGSWKAAIAEVAEDGDEDKLDAEGWWVVKDMVLSDIGAL